MEKNGKINQEIFQILTFQKFLRQVSFCIVVIWKSENHSIKETFLYEIT